MADNIELSCQQLNFHHITLCTSSEMLPACSNRSNRCSVPRTLQQVQGYKVSHSSHNIARAQAALQSHKHGEFGHFKNSFYGVHLGVRNALLNRRTPTFQRTQSFRFNSCPPHFVMLVTDFYRQIKRITITTTSAALVQHTSACVSKEPTILQPVHPTIGTTTKKSFKQHFSLYCPATNTYHQILTFNKLNFSHVCFVWIRKTSDYFPLQH